jgi:transcription elongation factor Elf1
MLEEHFFNCPYCGEKISMLLDLTEESQFYVEDCEVCCRPIAISFEVQNGSLESFEAQAQD